MSREYYDDYRHGASRKRRKSLPGSVFNGVMLILSVATGAAMIVTLLAPFVHPGRTWIFPVLGLVAPAVYVITLLVTLYWIIRWRWRIALPLVVLLLAGLFKVPLFLKPELRRHYGEETSSGRGTITLLTFNVRSFYNDRGQWSFDGVTEVIRRVNPDIVCLQEFNRTSSKAEELDSLLSDYDRTVVMEGNRRDPVFPLALYTKYRILGKSHSILGPMNQDGQSVWVDLLVGDDTIRIFNNHLHSTAITVHDDKYLSEHQFLTDTAGGAKIKNIFRRFRDNSMLRAAQADTIARAIAATPGCKIVCGDFNDTPMSYTYRVMAQDLDDAFRASGKGYSYTFRGFMDVLRIDYVLYSEDLECLDYQVLYDVDLSDHYPVVVRLRPVKR